MNAKEAGDLLAKCASYDRRTTGEADIIAWLQALGDLSYRDCEAAVVAHYADSTDWIMPAHIRHRVKEIRRIRLQDTEIPAPPPELLNNPPAYRAWLREAARRIADGEPADPPQAITGRHLRGIEAGR